jgi:hypothetical protein
MAFTYVGDLSTDLDKVRFNVQDVTSGDGPRPGKANFSDAELNGLLTVEGSWQRAVAAAFEALASAWARYASYTVGPRGEQIAQISQMYKAMASEWRGEWGYGQTSTGQGVVASTRVDGYSDDIAADEVDMAESEYEPQKYYIEYGD